MPALQIAMISWRDLLRRRRGRRRREEEGGGGKGGMERGEVAWREAEGRKEKREVDGGGVQVNPKSNT